MVPGNCTPLGRQTTEGSPSLTWQARGGSFEFFCYLGLRHALSSQWLCKLTAWKQFRTCYQFCLPANSLSRHVAACTALVCGAQCSMPVRLGHWQSQTSNVCSGMKGQWSDRSAMPSSKILSPPGPMSYLCSLAFRIWTLVWRREGSAGMGMWNAPMVQSRQPLTNNSWWKAWVW